MIGPYPGSRQNDQLIGNYAPSSYEKNPFHGINISSTVTNPEMLDLIKSMLTVKVTYLTDPLLVHFANQRYTGESFACAELAGRLNNLDIEQLKEITEISLRCFGAYMINILTDRISIIDILSNLRSDKRQLCLNWTQKLLPFTYTVNQKNFNGSHFRSVFANVSLLHTHSSFEKILKESNAESKRLRRENKDIQEIHQSIIDHLERFVKTTLIYENANSDRSSPIYPLLNKTIPV